MLVNDHMDFTVGCFKVDNHLLFRFESSALSKGLWLIGFVARLSSCFTMMLLNLHLLIQTSSLIFADICNILG